VKCLLSQKSSGWSYNEIKLQGSIWCSVYDIKKHLDGVTIECNCMVQYGGVFIFFKRFRMELQ
jgi:hypothetical protein